MPAKVYFVKAKEKEGTPKVIQKLGNLLDESGCFSFVEKEEIVAVKVTFGEDGNKYFMGPEYIKVVTDKIGGSGARVFLTDANVLYKGKRKRRYAQSYPEIGKTTGYLRLPRLYKGRRACSPQDDLRRGRE